MKLLIAVTKCDILLLILSRVCSVTRQSLVDSGFGDSIYWTLPVVTTIIHPLDNFATHKADRFHLTRPISSSCATSVTPSVFLCVSSVSHPPNTVLHELNREHLVAGLGCHAND
jgi:hypothetical protein